MIKIKEKKNCNGCHACMSICPTNCIAMEEDTEGFWYPKADNKECIKCRRCIEICPLINKLSHDNPNEFLNAYACKNKDENIRIESSSGGIFSLLAEEILNKGGVVFGAGFDSEFYVRQQYTENKEHLGKLRGSKYVQSKIGETYKQVRSLLLQNRRVLFSGTPCQIGGLKSYLGQTYSNLLCVDFICHGVPSPTVWNRYKHYLEKRLGSPLKKFNFRSKEKGWQDFSVYAKFNNNKEYSKTHKQDIFMRAFLRDICLRPSCHDCGFKTINRESDITLADFWGIQNVIPEMNDNKGTSLIWTNSEYGERTVNLIREKIELSVIDLNKAIQYNSAAIKSSIAHKNREDFFIDLNNNSFEKVVKKYCFEPFHIEVLKAIKRKIISLIKT